METPFYGYLGIISDAIMMVHGLVTVLLNTAC